MKRPVIKSIPYFFTSLAATCLLTSCMKFNISETILSESQPPPLPSGASVVSRWEFENNWQDTVGTNHGSPVTPSTPAFTTDKLLGAAAADLSSSGARLDIGTASTLTPTNLTVSFWIKRTAPYSSSSILMWTKPCTNWAHLDGYYIGLEGTGKAVTLVVSGGNFIGVDADPDVVFGLNTWSHVAITFDSTLHEGHIYINGVDQPLSTTGSPQVIQPAIGTSKFIGSCDNGTQILWPLDELAVLNGALSAAEVTALYQTQKTAAGI